MKCFARCIITYFVIAGSTSQIVPSVKSFAWRAQPYTQERVGFKLPQLSLQVKITAGLVKTFSGWSNVASEESQSFHRFEHNSLSGIMFKSIEIFESCIKAIFIDITSLGSDYQGALVTK